MEDLPLLVNPFCLREPWATVIYPILHQNARTQGCSPRWGLILGPVKFLSTSAICGSSYESIMSSAIGEALSVGPSATQEQTVVYRKFNAPTAEREPGP